MQTVHKTGHEEHFVLSITSSLEGRVKMRSRARSETVSAPLYMIAEVRGRRGS